MFLGGYQKVSLIDFPGLVASVVFLRGCDFMCPYCHNPELISMEGNVVLEEEFFSMLLKNRRMLDGVCVSGGEPCLQPALPEFLSKLKDLGFKIKLDTNGSEPDMLAFVLRKGLVDYVAMDVKSSWKNYPLVTHRKHAAVNAKKSLAILGDSGIDHEFRTTIFPGVHTIDDFISIAGYLRNGSKYFIQNIKREKTLTEITAESDLFAKDIAEKLESRFPNLLIGNR
ncbi:MAG: anaerobic ribonucleoside-triphosphate reductase activating protein [Parcubacteria group bacterium]